MYCFLFFFLETNWYQNWISQKRSENAQEKCYVNVISKVYPKQQIINDIVEFDTMCESRLTKARIFYRNLSVCVSLSASLS